MSKKTSESNWTTINGLQVKYIGSCCESFSEESVRDYILVTAPPYETYSGIQNQYRLFYKSTGTADEVSNRKNTWFPCNGFLNKLIDTPHGGQIFINWIDKGGYFKLRDELYNPNRNYKLMYNLSRDLSIGGRKEIRSILTERFFTDDNFKISMKLGGGLWDIYELFNNIRLDHNETEKYQLPKRVYKSYEEINAIVGVNNEYGIPLENALEMSNLLYEIVNQNKWNDRIKKVFDTFGEENGYQINISQYLLEDPKYNENTKYLKTIPHHEVSKLVAKIGYQSPSYNHLLEMLQIEQTGGMYRYIVNPKTNRKVKISTKLGKKILKNYLIQLGGYNGPCAMNNDTGRCKQSTKNDGKCKLNKKTGYCVKIKKSAAKKPAAKKPAAKKPAAEKPTAEKPAELKADVWRMPINKIANIDYLEDIRYSPEPEDLQKRREMIVEIYNTYEQYINIDDTIPHPDDWELPPQLQTKEELENNFRDYIQDFERAILERNDTHPDIVLDKNTLESLFQINVSEIYAHADDMYEWGLPELNKIKYDPTYISNYSTGNKPINISTEGDKLSALKAQIIDQMGKENFWNDLKKRHDNAQSRQSDVNDLWYPS